MKRMITIGILAMLTAACSAGQGTEAKRPLTEAQRDSVLSRSDLPGASVVGRAMSASGAEQRHADAENALTDSLPR
jgi:hypothetical protein